MLCEHYHVRSLNNPFSSIVFKNLSKALNVLRSLVLSKIENITF
jgi:hypothetical protein